MTLLGLVLLVGVGLALFTEWKARQIEIANPNRGTLTDLGDFKINSLLVEPGIAADLPPIVFIHGASGNLNDPAGALLAPLEGRAQLLFVDRPGHGYSERGGDENSTPAGQADAIARLMDKKGIKRAIIVGHSFGASITAALAVRHPEKVAGLVFLSPATHPWPGGVDWYYDLAATPILGTLFCHTLAIPAGLMRIDKGIEFVFSPNPVPPRYVERASIELVLRPENFCNNARDVAGLQAYVAANQRFYKNIHAPTVILTGDQDNVVLEELHSRGLAKDIAGSELVWIKGLGHKPDYIATDLAIAAIEKVAGRDRDLQAMAQKLEKRLASN